MPVEGEILDDITSRGPLAGQPIPLFGGQPDAGGCNGCTDCCHLPEISVTDEEAARLRRLHAGWEGPIAPLSLRADPAHEGWQMMQGPCVFRQVDRPLAAGGCRIYADRPAGCDIFTCAYRLALRRALSCSESRAD
jgi:Fe-S-cluster containining protein